jgi:hypothetical protein
MLESLSRSNPVPGSASPIDPDLAFGVNLTCLFSVGVCWKDVNKRYTPYQQLCCFVH